MAEQLGQDVVMNGDQTKRRNARHRAPVVAESEPLELTETPLGAPSGVRPALALTAAGRPIQLNDGSTDRNSWDVPSMIQNMSRPTAAKNKISPAMAIHGVHSLSPARSSSSRCFTSCAAV
jgi:hypothetical protein